MLSTRLKEARLLAHLTQKAVAEKVGIAVSTYSGYELGTSEPDVNTFGKLMEVLNVDANYLYQDVYKKALEKGKEDTYAQFECSENKKKFIRIISDMPDKLLDELMSYIKKEIS